MAKNKKYPPMKIKKGFMVYVSVKTDAMSDKRFFTQSGKLNKFLKFIVKNQTSIKIRFRQIRLN